MVRCVVHMRRALRRESRSPSSSKELPGATGLSDAPASVALERLTATAARAEYAAPPPPPPSLLVVYEGRLSYQVPTHVSEYVG